MVSTMRSSNLFIISQDNSYDGAKSLYITDDGLMNNYSTIATSYAYAYRSITFEAGVYELSYAWIGYGESYYDYGRLFLVPDDIDINMSNSSSVITMTNIPAGRISCKNNMCLSSQWAR